MNRGEFRELSPDARTALAVRSAIGGAQLGSVAKPDFDVAAYDEELVTGVSARRHTRGTTLGTVLIAA